MIAIRDETPGDGPAIADLTARAFAGVAYSDGSEPGIVARLRAAGELVLSLVAVEEIGDGAAGLVGHVAFSPVSIDGVDLDWFGLGPVSVAPERQRAGIGSALIRDGLDRLRGRGARGCVVLGDPGYYARFGFVRMPALRYIGAPAEYFQCIAFGTGIPEGQVEYANAFAGGGQAARSPFTPRAPPSFADSPANSVSTMAASLSSERRSSMMLSMSAIV